MKACLGWCSADQGLQKPRVYFIKYLIGNNGEDAHDVFNRINGGKLPLKSAELIRALYMTSDIETEKKMEIAKEWELIERELWNPVLWEMLDKNDKKDFETVRIDLLFAIVSGVKYRDMKADPLAIYHSFENRIMDDKEKGIVNKSRLDDLWKELLLCFHWLQSCCENTAIHNYWGWLSSFSENRLSTVYKWWFESGCKMINFEKKIKEVIKSDSYLKDHLDSLSSVCYGDAGLKKLLLFLNVLQCNKSNEYFPFRRYENTSWDIEHIDSQTPNELNNLTDKASYIKLSLIELKVQYKSWDVAYNRLNLGDLCSMELVKSLVQKLKEYEQDIKNAADKNNENVESELERIENSFMEQSIRLIEKNPTVIQTLCERIKKEFPSGLEGKNKNEIGNLVLLDSKTNRSYGNAPFPGKRRKIRKNVIDKEQVFVLPCTKNAFMKLYTSVSTQSTSWSVHDAEGYRAAMQTLVDDFMND